VDPNDRFVVQELLQSTESEIFLMKKKLKLPIGEHSMGAEIAAGMVRVGSWDGSRAGSSVALPGH